MDYFTFVAAPPAWRVYHGVGGEGPPLVERQSSARLVDFDAARQPIVWMAGHEDLAERPFVMRLGLFDLRGDTIPWDHGRLGALACSPDGLRAIALRLPAAANEQVELWRWHGERWDRIDTAIRPDISSRVAWLDDRRIAYESSARTLVVLDPDTGHAETGPPGSLPARGGNRDWIAMSQGRATRFPIDSPFAHPEVVRDFEIGDAVRLRLSADGAICTWAEATAPMRSTGYIQQRHESRRRFPVLDDGAALGAVVGPYERGGEP